MLNVIVLTLIAAASFVGFTLNVRTVNHVTTSVYTSISTFNQLQYVTETVSEDSTLTSFLTSTLTYATTKIIFSPSLTTITVGNSTILENQTDTVTSTETTTAFQTVTETVTSNQTVTITPAYYNNTVILRWNLQGADANDTVNYAIAYSTPVVATIQGSALNQSIRRNVNTFLPYGETINVTATYTVLDPCTFSTFANIEFNEFSLVNGSNENTTQQLIPSLGSQCNPETVSASVVWIVGVGLG